MISIVKATPLRLDVMRAGCPLNNLAQEMSQRDERFRKHLANLFHEWQESQPWLCGGGDRKVRSGDVDARETVSFLIAM